MQAPHDKLSTSHSGRQCLKSPGRHSRAARSVLWSGGAEDLRSGSGGLGRPGAQGREELSRRHQELPGAGPDGQRIDVVIDNLSAHKSKTTKAWSQKEQRGTVLRGPPTAPGANPIEPHFGPAPGVRAQKLRPPQPRHARPPPTRLLGLAQRKPVRPPHTRCRTGTARRDQSGGGPALGQASHPRRLSLSSPPARYPHAYQTRPAREHRSVECTFLLVPGALLAQGPQNCNYMPAKLTNVSARKRFPVALDVTVQ